MQLLAKKARRDLQEQNGRQSQVEPQRSQLCKAWSSLSTAQCDFIRYDVQLAAENAFEYIDNFGEQFMHEKEFKPDLQMVNIKSKLFNRKRLIFEENKEAHESRILGELRFSSFKLQKSYNFNSMKHFDFRQIIPD